MEDFNFQETYEWVLETIKKHMDIEFTLSKLILTFIFATVITFAKYVSRREEINFANIYTNMKNQLFEKKKLIIAIIAIIIIIVIPCWYIGSPLEHQSPKIQQKVDIQGMLDQVCKEAFPKDVKPCEYIREKVKNMDVQNILKEPIDDLYNILGLEDATEMEALLKMRVDLRYKLFQTRKPLKIDELINKVNKLDWDQVCQLLEEHVKPNSRKQRLEWYKYIEENDINGPVLLQTKNIVAALNLNVGQKAKFDRLLHILRGTREETAKTTITVNDEAKVGLVNAGDNNEFNASIHIGDNNANVADPKKKEGQEQPNEKDDVKE